MGKEYKLKGKVRGIYRITPGAERNVEPLQSADLTLDGMEGDRHQGETRLLKRRTGEYPAGVEVRNTRQLSLISSEELREIAAELEIEGIIPEDLSPNLIIEGIPALTLLPPGTRLVFESGAGVVVEGYNPPCTSSGERIANRNPGREGLPNRFVKAAIYKRGVVGWVESPGAVKMGDGVTALLPSQPPYPSEE